VFLLIAHLRSNPKLTSQPSPTPTPTDDAWILLTSVTPDDAKTPSIIDTLIESHVTESTQAQPQLTTTENITQQQQQPITTESEAVAATTTTVEESSSENSSQEEEDEDEDDDEEGVEVEESTIETKPVEITVIEIEDESPQTGKMACTNLSVTNLHVDAAR
jgi:hypothetical protein